MDNRERGGNLVGVRPGDREELRVWLKRVLGIWVPGSGRCAQHDSPMDYLEHVFFERGDAVVWANRGGGKTFYGAVATLLDLVFKPGIEVRILGGSLDQSGRMGDYLRVMFEREGLRDLVKRKTGREICLWNGSRVELLAQAETSVRGQRVQKLRCDEVELFEREVWEAGQFVTRSAVCGGVEVRGSVEAMSTLHRPGGLMSELVGKAWNAELGVPSIDSLSDTSGSARRRGQSATPGARLFTWCALDVMDRCKLVRECARCELADCCAGRAREWRGFLGVRDVIGQRVRSSVERFGSEMLCRSATRGDAVYGAFDVGRHVRPVEADRGLRWVCGVDFGMRNFAWLWAQLREAAGWMRVEVMDELLAKDRTLEMNLEEVRRRGWPGAAWLGVDPAGHQRSDQTGQSAIGVLRRSGFVVRSRRVGLRDGIEAVKSRLDPAVRVNEILERGHQGDRGLPGTPLLGGGGERGGNGALLVIHPRCEGLIAALRGYRFDGGRGGEEPVKDGCDHAADALRYLMVNLETAGAVKSRGY